MCVFGCFGITSIRIFITVHSWTMWYQGRIQGGGGRTRRAPSLKLEKIWFFGVKSWFFTRNTPKIFVILSARRNFFKCTPLTWNPGSAPGYIVVLDPVSDGLSHTRWTITPVMHWWLPNNKIKPDRCWPVDYIKVVLDVMQWQNRKWQNIPSIKGS